jgi:hypothetical protein
MKCWICGNEARTGEHLIKASDLRAIFGSVRQTRPVYLTSANRKNLPVKGVNANIFKSAALLCGQCNNERTQPFDRAWEALSRYLRKHGKLAGGDRIDLSKVFPGSVHKSMLSVHLYFVKLFGCLIAGNSIPIEPFASAIVESAPHPKVHLALSSYVDRVPSGSAGYSDLDTAQLNGQVVYATWMYILDRFSIRIMYAEPGEHRRGLVNSWHPSSPAKYIRVSKF